MKGRNQMIQRIKNKLAEERAGATTMEYVLIGAIAVGIVVVIFAFLGPTLFDKVNEITDNIANSGSGWMPAP